MQISSIAEKGPLKRFVQGVLRVCVVELRGKSPAQATVREPPVTKSMPLPTITRCREQADRHLRARIDQTYITG